ncbi:MULTISPECIES: hypothetical protein [unclassified Streptomyces]|uniref:hypothetical protein n=1 Tax=unclassified Streptomyces TaxID=2593676 RepID=UPI000366EA5B|nr:MULTISPECIES: hypothetical protein [unclassified Streptomyces]MYT29589.1 hypothetical protein [Streptomyces sp. SID8354]
MTSPTPPAHRSRRGGILLACVGLTVAALLIGGALWARSNIGVLKEARGGNAWDLVYEGTALSGDARAVTVRYRHNPDRFKPEYKDEQVGATPLPWRKEALVNTGQTARVVIEPEPGTVASCRILLDGVRVVAQGTSPAPGRPAVCQVTTSSTPEKWPR